MHAIEYRWLDALRTVKLFAYRLPAASFRPFGTPVPHAHVSTVPVEPLRSPQEVGDLLDLHEHRNSSGPFAASACPLRSTR